MEVCSIMPLTGRIFRLNCLVTARSFNINLYKAIEGNWYKNMFLHYYLTGHELMIFAVIHNVIRDHHSLDIGKSFLLILLLISY